VRPEDREGVDQGLRESFETGKPQPLKYVFILPDGTRKNIETISQPVWDESGTLRLMGTVMDVTERVTAEEAIRQSEANLRHVIDTIPGMVWSARPDGYVEFHNQRWIDYTGLSAQEANGWGWRAAIHPEDLPGLESHWQSLLTSGKAGEGEARFRRFDGEYRWFLFRCVPLHDATGKLVQWLGTNTDIEELKRTTSALQASELLARGQLNALTRTLDALASESEPDKFLDHVLRNITEELRAHSSSVWRFDAASGLLNFEFAFENGGLVTTSNASIAAVSPPLPIEAVCPWPEIFRTGRPHVLEDIRQGPHFPWRDRLIEQGVVTILTVPMMIAGQVEGVIGIRFTSQRVVGAAEMELAQAFANQAMLAMQLTRLSAQSRQTAVMAERNRMARDIHDTLAQGFTGIIMQLEAANGAASKGDTVEVSNRIERAEELARESLGEARRSVRALRPRSLEGGKLPVAIDDLLKRMTDGTGLNVDFKAQGNEQTLPADCEDVLLRIAQESLTNTIRHANARNFSASLIVKEGEIQLQLVDDGGGFDTEKENEGFGLLGMRERVVEMGGQLMIRSKPGVGTEILVTLKRQPQVKTEDIHGQG
jgi:PAS domain S-box-containing protein